MVLLHGLPLDTHSWDDVVAALPAEDVLRVDLPGNGRSTGSVHMDRVAWLDAVMAEVTEPVLLVGHSLGTEFALRYAAARPEKVAGLLLISPFFLQGMAPLPLRYAAIGWLILSLINRSRYEQLASGQQMQQTPMLDSGYAALRRPRVRRNVAEALAAANNAGLRDELVGMGTAVSVGWVEARVGVATDVTTAVGMLGTAVGAAVVQPAMTSKTKLINKEFR